MKVEALQTKQTPDEPCLFPHRPVTQDRQLFRRKKASKPFWAGHLFSLIIYDRLAPTFQSASTLFASKKLSSFLLSPSPSVPFRRQLRRLELKCICKLGVGTAERFLSSPFPRLHLFIASCKAPLFTRALRFPTLIAPLFIALRYTSISQASTVSFSSC